MGNTIKCDSCGKYISYDDLDSGKADAEYTPDSYFTVEGVEFVCKKCKEERGRGR